MENLTIEATTATPEIRSDLTAGTVSFVGKSYPEDTFTFYKPILEWIEAFIEEKKERELTFVFEIAYYNSSSSKLFFELFDTLEEANQDGASITVKWYHDEENEMMQEAGEDFAEDFENLPFNILIK